MSSEPQINKTPNILGKDFFTEDEAIFYACVSKSQFRERAKDYGINPGIFMGRKVYRRSDLHRAMEKSWHQSPTVEMHES